MTARLDSPGNASPVHMPEEGCAERWRLRFWSIFGGQASLAGFLSPSLLALDHQPARQVDERS